MAVVALLITVALATTSVWAQESESRQERVHAAVVVTLHGERTPLLLSTPSELTPLGAQQMFAAGTYFRRRYITASRDDGNGNSNGSSAAVPMAGLPSYQIPRAQLYIAAPNFEYTASSAMAFTQGLYPPLSQSSGNPIINEQSVLANGSNIESPLGGYQYPRIVTPSDLDPISIFLSGDVGCPQYTISGARYFDTPEFGALDAQSRELYRSYQTGALSGIAPSIAVGYRNAFNIYDHVRYAKTHNRTVDEQVSDEELARLRALAAERERVLNSNLTATGGAAEGGAIRAVAGRALATQVLGLLSDHVDSQGTVRKLSAVFGNHRLFMAFFALSRLSDINPTLTLLPNLGSSMVFELYSVGNATDGGRQGYPDESALKVRFMFRNGSSGSEALTRYPLFVRPGSLSDPSWRSFRAEMAQIMFPTVGDWCNACGSQRLFCALFRGDNEPGSGSSRASRTGGRGGMPLAVAGIIGAIVTLAVLALVAGAAFLFGRVRLRRAPSRRQSALGGFKGSEKLASDPDLAGGKGSSINTHGPNHERVGSWELKNHVPIHGGESSQHRPSTMESRIDQHDDPAVNPFAEPVKAYERV
ncbi:MAG: hypothetical protein M1823_002502 [Watsoniomyces obsoletus]|nr:MAG: hypothetical protein M1823_002502 [Watsoniomyces obsoletus]